MTTISTWAVGLCLAVTAHHAFADFSAELAAVSALGDLTNAPTMWADDTSMATTNAQAGEVTALYYDGLDYSGSTTRVFAYVGIPAGASADNPVPAVVLLHGGGGTAFPNWVMEWTNRGYAAISMGLEGQMSAMPGPARVGVYHDAHLALTNQWMYHAVADTVLANSLMRSLPEVGANKVGLTGISWGGVITSTAMGIDNRFAFAVPVYGCGRLYDALNHYQGALANNDLYKQVWDPVLWLENATMPALWLSWPGDFHYPMDCQASSYHAAPGPRMVSLVPGMGHGHGAGWHRPESYDFADGVLSDGSPWCEQQNLSVVGNQATVVFRSTKTLSEATLISTTGTGKTGDLAWPENPADSLVEGPPGTWTVTATLPADATGWFINVKAAGSDTMNLYGYADANVIASSDYQEIIDVTLFPAGGLDDAHPIEDLLSTGTVQVAFTAPTNVEIIDVQIRSDSHAEAFSSADALPRVLWTPAPAREVLYLQFDNSVAGLTEGQTATGMLEVVWENLDGTTDQVQVPIRTTARSPSTVVYDVTADWSSKTVYRIDDVVIRSHAMVTLDQDVLVGSLTVADEASPAGGTLHIQEAVDLIVTGAITLGSGTGGGIVTQSVGTVAAESLTVNTGGSGDMSQYSLSGGTVVLTDDLTVNANGEVHLAGGLLDVGDDTPTVVTVNGDGKIHIGGGTLSHVFLPAANHSFTFAGDGIIQLDSGTLEVTGADNGSDVIRVQTDMEITGGVLNLDGQIAFDSPVPTEFKVVGDAATIEIERLNQAACCNRVNTTFHFVFGADGVSTITMRYYMNLAGANIVVDGSAYSGGAGEHILFDSTSFLGLSDTNNITVSGFPGFRASIVQDDADGRDHVKLLLVSLYDTWADEVGLSGANAHTLADPEGDGMVNLLEYACGGSPTRAGDANPLNVTHLHPDRGFQGVEFLYHRRRDAGARGLTYTVQATSNLVSSGWTRHGITEVGTAVMDADFEWVTNRIETMGHVFGRLSVSLDE